MKFSIIHPTARVTPDFEHPWWEAFASAYVRCDAPELVEYILVVHVSRIADFWACFPTGMRDDDRNRTGWGKLQIVTNYGRDCLVDQCNAGQLAMSGEILVGNQDDMRFPEYWDTEIAKLIPDTSKFVCVQAKTDGARPDLLTIPTIATKPLVDAIGPVSPEYDGMYSDDEWSLKAFPFAISSGLYFRHLHPANGTGKGDAVHAMENREEAYKIGWDTFRRRKALGFPRVELPGFEMRGAPALPTRKKERILALCTPGEQHCGQWSRERDRLVFGLASQGWVIRTYWDYTTNVYHTRMGITRDIIADAQKTGEAPELVLWIDDDNIPSLQAAQFQISTLEEHPEYSGAAGWCWIKFREDGKIQWMPSCGNFKPDTMFLLPTLLDDLYADNAAPKQIEWSGFPHMLVRYDALVQLGMEAFRPLFCEENEFGFTGEDTAFFACAMEAGLKFCVVPQAKVEHLKLQAIEPDYLIGENANPAKAAGVESDRSRRNGERMEVSREVKEFMGVAM